MDREHLIKLLQCSPTDIMGNHGVGALADHLITNDVVPVIRCKDCYWRNRNCCMHPTDGMNVTNDDDFCSYGERKDNAQ